MVAQSAAVSTPGPATPALLPAWDSATAALIAALVAGLFALVARALAAFRLTFPQASVPRVSAWAVSAGLAAAAACCVQGQDPCKPLSCCWSWLKPALPSSLLAYCASLLLEPALAVLFSHQHAAAPAGGAGTPPGYPNVHPPRPAAAAASLHAGWRLRSAALPMPEAPLLTAPVIPPPAAPHGDTMLAGRLAWAAVRLALVSGWLRHVSQGSSSGPLAGGALAGLGLKPCKGGWLQGTGRLWRGAVAWRWRCFGWCRHGAVWLSSAPGGSEGCDNTCHYMQCSSTPATSLTCSQGKQLPSLLLLLLLLSSPASSLHGHSQLSQLP
ncbi:hypothetical protein QJQ45_001426 [Haematococcus lacustris]|nr:hypothetical protein QJQ45_001426 [Haematococcus lacustris]